jgi:CubicO group peptidase (beta-lactamase class C family)
MMVLVCQSCKKNLINDAGYQPVDRDDGWQISTAEEQNVDPEKLKDVYLAAGQLNNIYSLVVVKNGFLVGEKYFNGSNYKDANSLASVTKSFSSALVGIALRENILPGLDQKMMDYFPEINWQNLDPKKSEITIRQVLQMRSGYPWEEFDGYLDILFSRSNYIPFLEEFPLMSDPGTQFSYSILTSHMIGIILTRASGTSLHFFAETYLFDPLDATIAFWLQDSLGYYYSDADLYLTPRDMAKFGQLYLEKGVYNNSQIIPADWVTESFRTYSPTTYEEEILNSIHQLGYGYFWWSANAGTHHINFAWGHGGQLIFIIDDLNMVVVTSAKPQARFDNAAWQKEKAVVELVGSFVSSF